MFGWFARRRAARRQQQAQRILAEIMDRHSIGYVPPPTFGAWLMGFPSRSPNRELADILAADRNFPFHGSADDIRAYFDMHIVNPDANALAQMTVEAWLEDCNDHRAFQHRPKPAS